jgi:hypothetical protein
MWFSSLLCWTSRWFVLSGEWLCIHMDIYVYIYNYIYIIIYIYAIFRDKSWAFPAKTYLWSLGYPSLALVLPQYRSFKGHFWYPACFDRKPGSKNETGPRCYSPVNSNIAMVYVYIYVYYILILIYYICILCIEYPNSSYSYFGMSTWFSLDPHQLSRPAKTKVPEAYVTFLGEEDILRPGRFDISYKRAMRFRKRCENFAGTYRFRIFR